MPLQQRTLSSAALPKHTHKHTNTHRCAHSLYQNERVRLAAKAGLAQGLMMPGMRLLSTTAG